MLLCWFCGGQLDALFSGVWPRVDHRGVRHPPQSREGKKAGKYLAGGFYGIVMALIGDLDYMNKFLGLPHWASAANPCNLCLCTKAGPLTWKDSRPNAPWRATTYTTGSWQANPDRSKNPIFDAANISGLSCQSDYMHVKYLGYRQFFLGSVLWLLAHEILLGEPLANIRAICCGQGASNFPWDISWCRATKTGHLLGESSWQRPCDGWYPFSSGWFGT
jgi:hypothetical protein